MDKQRRKRLESAGWTVVGACEFLRLTEDEAAIGELKLDWPARSESRGGSDA